MISSSFRKYDKVTTNPLYQWDMNQSLEIVCDDITAAPEIHFCNKNYQIALVDKATLTSYGFRCMIPNELLTEPYDIIAYIYIERNSEGNTVGVINIPIIERTKPEDFDLKVRTIRITTTVESIVLMNNNIAEIGVSLNLRPDENVIVHLSSGNEEITLSDSELTFTPENYSETQYITVGMETDNIASSIAYLRLTSDKAGSKIVILNLKEEIIEYSVDNTIPDGGVITPLSDWTYLDQAPSRVLLQKYNGKDTNIIIPAKFDEIDAPVMLAMSGSNIGIGDNVEYVTLEKGVTVFNNDASVIFSNSKALKGISGIPDSTTMLSLKGCTSLEFVRGLPDLINLTYVTFEGCTSLVQLPDLSALTTITAFNNFAYGCTSLKHIFGLPTNLVNMRSAFYNCPLEYLGSRIPKTVTDLFYAFSGNKLSEITIEATDVENYECVFGKMINHFIKINVRKGSATAEEFMKQFRNNSVAISYIDEDTTTITAWGDSITSSDQFGSFGSWATGLMSYLPNVFISNMAISGEYTLSTSARQGGNELFANADFTIPADTSPVTVGLIDKYGNQVGSVFPLSTEKINPCKIGKIEGVLTASGANISFTRLKEGAKANISKGTKVQAYGSLYNNDFTDIMIIYMGTNDGWGENNETLLKQIDDMILCFNKPNYIVISPCSGKYVRDTDSIQNIKNLETLMNEKYGSKYINLREKMISGVLEFNGLSPTEEDTSRMEIGQIPRTVLASESDDTHGNDYFHKYLAKLVYDKLIELNYIS